MNLRNGCYPFLDVGKARGSHCEQYVPMGCAYQTLRKSAAASSQSSQQMWKATAASWALTRSAIGEHRGRIANTAGDSVL